MKISKYFLILVVFIPFLMLENCGPVIVSSRPSQPTPSWFYPDRVINVRYIYFPEYLIYYDLLLRNYIYLDNGVWITVQVLPTRFNTINFRHARQVRVTNYFGDDIRHYHSTIRVPVDGRREVRQPMNSRTEVRQPNTSRSSRSTTERRSSRRGN